MKYGICASDKGRICKPECVAFSIGLSTPEISKKLGNQWVSSYDANKPLEIVLFCNKDKFVINRIDIEVQDEAIEKINRVPHQTLEKKKEIIKELIKKGG